MESVGEAQRCDQLDLGLGRGAADHGEDLGWGEAVVSQSQRLPVDIKLEVSTPRVEVDPDNVVLRPSQTIFSLETQYLEINSTEN